LGLRIEDNVVVVDHASKEHLQTTVEGNPIADQIDALRVLSVFQRRFASAKRSRNRGEKLIGDNCPLIYALKGKDGLTVELCSIKALNASIPGIIEKIVGSIGSDFELIISMPSSSTLAAILGKRLSRAIGRPHSPTVFCKATNKQAMSLVATLVRNNPRSIPHDEEIAVRNVLKFLKSVESDPYTAKNVKPAIRKYFSPLVIAGIPANVAPDSRILLVDDLLSTGETFRSACRLLREAGFDGQHAAVTWFSRVRK
jgi:hypothetical protein